MKKQVQWLCTGLIIGAMIAGATSVFAKTSWLEAIYDSIKVMVNGNEITMTDADGNTVEPFIVNGTTYLPVRAVGNALGKNVYWDENAKAVNISDYNQSTFFSELPYDSCSNFQNLKLVHSNGGVGFTSKSEERTNKDGTKYFTVPTENLSYTINCAKVTGTLMPPVSDNPCEAIYDIYNNGQSYSVTLTNNSAPVKFEVPNGGRASNGRVLVSIRYSVKDTKEATTVKSNIENFSAWIE